MAILLDMTRTHVPVLAGELIDLLDPRPGDTAIDPLYVIRDSSKGEC